MITMTEQKIKLIQGDITKVEVDAIVNAANSSLLGGGGVDGAIHRAGGPAILEECRAIRARQGGCKTGEAVITTAGDLPSQYVIHTVGPIWTGDASEAHCQLLYNCYHNSLELAIQHDIKTIAFPNISTGIYRFPKPLAAETAIQSVRDFLQLNKEDEKIEEVIFVCFDEDNYGLYEKYLE